MLDSKKISIYKRVIKKWGSPLQLILTIEELAELQKALTKHLRYSDPENYTHERELRQHLTEEMADVEIMLEQLKLIFDNDNDVKKAKKHKLNRLENLLREKN